MAQAGAGPAGNPAAGRSIDAAAEMQDGAAKKAESEGPPGRVRGTQFFVGVMTEVWHRPSLSVLEILWRWSAGAPALALAGWRVWRISQGGPPDVHLDTSALQAMTVFQPVAALSAIHAAWAAVLPAAESLAAWLLPLAAFLWLVMATLGRTAVLRRLDKTLAAQRRTLLGLYALRSTLLTGAWMLWAGLVRQAGVIAITAPAAKGADPDLVLYSALLICGSLLVYVLWAVVNWPLQLAPLLAMQLKLGVGASLRSALGSRRAGGKLLEVNLVMSIVKIALLVLAMVFSACPLPFANLESPAFLRLWWVGVILLYMASLDYFHVVQSVAHLRLWRAMREESKG
ncbi:MAG: hypothetical protein ACLGQU_01735 [Acidobacteriota bacterium]